MHTNPQPNEEDLAETEALDDSIEATLEDSIAGEVEKIADIDEQWNELAEREAALEEKEADLEEKTVNINTVADKTEREAGENVGRARETLNAFREKASDNPALAQNRALQQQIGGEKGQSDYDPTKIIVRAEGFKHPNFEAAMDHIVKHRRAGSWWFDKDDGLYGSYYFSFEVVAKDKIDDEWIKVIKPHIGSTVGGQPTSYVLNAAAKFFGLDPTIFLGGGSVWLKDNG